MPPAVKYVSESGTAETYWADRAVNNTEASNTIGWIIRILRSHGFDDEAVEVILCDLTDEEVEQIQKDTILNVDYED